MRWNFVEGKNSGSTIVNDIEIILYSIRAQNGEPLMGGEKKSKVNFNSTIFFWKSWRTS